MSMNLISNCSDLRPFFFVSLPSRHPDTTTEENFKKKTSELQWRSKGQECAFRRCEMFSGSGVTHGKWSGCVWFTYFLSVQMNDGPLCKCSAKARRTGIRHSIYPGEEVWHAVNKSPFPNLEVVPHGCMDIILVSPNIHWNHIIGFIIMWEQSVQI